LTLFRWLGVAGFELRSAGDTLLIDPFLTRPPVFKLVFGRTRPNGALLRKHLPRAEYILVSHSHYDHLLDVVEIAGYTGAVVFGSEHTCSIATACNLLPGQIRKVQVGEKLALGEFVVEILQGEHAPLMFFGPGKLPKNLRYPMRLRDFVLDATFSFRIQDGEISLLAWHNWHPGPAPQADVLLLGSDILLKDLPALLEQVQPSLVIPVHWDNFFRPLNRSVQPFFRPPSWVRPLLDRYDPVKVGHMAERIVSGLKVKVPELLVEYDLVFMPKRRSSCASRDAR